MKKVKLLIVATFLAITLGLPAKTVFAATVELTQANFTAAAANCDGAHPVNGINCVTAGLNGVFILGAGDYKLAENITLDKELYTNDNIVTLNLNGKNLSSNQFVALNLGPGKVTINGNGTISGTDRAISIASTIYATDGTSTNPDTAGTHIINGGTYPGGLQVNRGNLTINSGTFTSENISTIVFFDADGSLTINGGTYTSSQAAGYYGVQAEGIKSLKITDGTFSGRFGGLSVADYASAALSGGTYKYTGTSDAFNTAGAIIIGNTNDTNKLSTLLAPGYAYTNAASNKATLGGLGGFDIVYLTSNSVDVYNTSNTNNAGGNSANNSSNNSSSSNSTTTKAAESDKSKKTLGSPDTGYSTTESGSANTSAVASIIAASILGLLAYASHRKFASKKA